MPKTSKSTPTGAPHINIGISDSDRAAIAKGLSHLLADTYTLYLTTHNFHWNVVGPMFNLDSAVGWRLSVQRWACQARRDNAADYCLQGGATQHGASSAVRSGA